MTVLTSLSWVLWAVAITLTALGTWRSLKRLSTPPPHLEAPFALFPVSILKPLKGTDSGLEDNLESFFQLDYPEFEIIFSAADTSDPSIRVVWRLMERYPRVKARLVIGEINVGTNPKVNNLVQSYELAQYDWLLISDSNVRVQSNYLKRQIAHLDSSVGMVTAVVAGHHARSLGGKIESAYLNTFYVRAMLLAEMLGRPCVVGKSMLFRRSTAERFGGIKTLARYLAEDYMAGEAVRRLGLRVIVAHDPISQFIGDYSVRDFWNRHVRWGRIRKAQAPLAFLIEPLFSCAVAGIWGAIAWGHTAGISWPIFLAIHLLLWGLQDGLLQHRMDPGSTWSSGFKTMPSWILRELSAPLLWIHIASGNTVLWRGSRLAILPGGLVEKPAT